MGVEAEAWRDAIFEDVEHHGSGACRDALCFAMAMLKSVVVAVMMMMMAASAQKSPAQKPCAGDVHGKAQASDGNCLGKVDGHGRK